MDRQLAERMVGAACLLAVLVLVVPAILDGNPDSGATITHPVAEDGLDLRTHTIRLDGTERAPPVPTPRELPQIPVAAARPEPAPEPAPEPEPMPDQRARQAAVAAADAPSPLADSGVTEPTPDSPRPRPAIAPTQGIEPATPTAATSTAGGAGDWFVQLGSFSRRENAEKLVANLRSAGFAASILGGGGASGSLYRVRAGPVADRPAAEALAGNLARAGFKDGRVGRQ
jgi:DedD protein